VPTVEVDGVPLAYDDVGHGAVVVLLLHAGIADRRMWRHQVAVLHERYRVLNVDLPGYGESGLPPEGYANHDAIVGLLTELGVGQAAVMGCSFGGAVAIDTTLAYPDRVGALALFGTAVSGHRWSEEFRGGCRTCPARLTCFPWSVRMWSIRACSPSCPDTDGLPPVPNSVLDEMCGCRDVPESTDSVVRDS
jgi:pimeloyl-ACP methyl ester carboxylesterase